MHCMPHIFGGEIIMKSEIVNKIEVKHFVICVSIWTVWKSLYKHTKICINGGLKMHIVNHFKYTKSLVNTNSFYTNFTNTHFQKVHIPHLTRTMKQKFLH